MAPPAPCETVVALDDARSMSDDTLMATTPGVIRADRTKLFDVILKPIALLDESLIAPLFFCGSKLLYQKVAELAYEQVILPIVIPGPDAEAADKVITPSKVASIASSPKLAMLVKDLRIGHLHPDDAPPPVSYDKSQAAELTENRRQEAWKLISWLIDTCRNVEKLDIELGMGINHDIWAAISSLKHLISLKIRLPEPHPALPNQKVAAPRLTPSLVRRSLESSSDTEESPFPLLVGNGGWTLGPAWDGLRTLELANLSLNGVKTLTTYFHLLSHHSRLTNLKLSSPFLDIGLCTAIVAVSVNLGSLTLSTSGSKFTGECLRAVIEGCQSLMRFVLDDIEGRLERDCWSTITLWPPRFRWLEIVISDHEDHYSWAHKHLESIHLVPISQLGAFVVRRKSHPLGQLPLLPPGINKPPVGAAPGMLPPRLLSQLQAAGGNLRYLWIDWWDVSVSGPNLFHELRNLGMLRISINGSMQQMISEAKETLPSLKELQVVSLAQYNIPNPASKTLVYNYSNASMPPEITEYLQTPDSSLPEIRDLRKFIRKMPLLHKLAWTGREGKGEWKVSRKSSRMADITFTPGAAVTLPVYRECQSPLLVFPFEEVPQNPNVPAFLSPPSPTKRVSSSEFPPLSRCTTLNSPPAPPFPMTPPTHVEPVLQDAGDALSKLSLLQSQSGPHQVLRLDITKISSKSPSPTKKVFDTTMSTPPPTRMARSSSQNDRASPEKRISPQKKSPPSRRGSPEKKMPPAGGGKRRVVSGLKSPPRARPGLPSMNQDGAGPSKQPTEEKSGAGGSGSGGGNGSGCGSTRSKEDKKTRRVRVASEDGWTLVGQSKTAVASGSGRK